MCGKRWTKRLDLKHSSDPPPITKTMLRVAREKKTSFLNKLCLKVKKKVREIAKEASVCFFSVKPTLEEQRIEERSPPPPHQLHLIVKWRAQLYLDPLILHQVGQNSFLYQLSLQYKRKKNPFFLPVLFFVLCVLVPISFFFPVYFLKRF